MWSLPKMTTVPFSVKSKQGLHYKIRIGDPVRDPEPYELEALFTYGRNYRKSNSRISDIADIYLELDSGFTKFILKQGRNYLEKRYGDVKKPIKKEILFLRIVGGGFLVPLFATLFYSINIQGSSIETVYLGMGFSLFIIPSILLFLVAQIASIR